MMKKVLFLILLVVTFYIPKVDAMQVHAIKIDGKNIVLKVESSDTIEAVKQKIYEIDSNYHYDHIRLVFKDKELEDGRTLADYGIMPDDTIKLFLKKYKVLFDANGGKFEDEESYLVEWNDDSYDNLIEPKKDGYYFKGYFTEKTGGTKLELILAEVGIDSDRIFYAQWEKAVFNPETSSNYGSLILLVISTFSFALLVYKVRKYLVNKL